jgi:RyR domain.
MNQIFYIEQIAKVCHDANKSFCEMIGDNSQVAWEQAPEWQKETMIAGVTFCIDNPNALPSANHDSWLKKKEEDGWKYGEIKDPETKTHPCIVPYEKLPIEQQKKNDLFKAIVAALCN